MRRFPKIRQPCPKQWDDLPGDARTRYCGECQYQVHNLSESSPTDAAAILSQPGRKCVAYRIRRSEPSRKFSRLCRPLVALATVVVALMSGACATTVRKDTAACQPVMQDRAEATGNTGDGKTYEVVVGEIMEERPLWKRILHIN